MQFFSQVLFCRHILVGYRHPILVGYNRHILVGQNRQILVGYNRHILWSKFEKNWTLDLHDLTHDFFMGFAHESRMQDFVSFKCVPKWIQHRITMI